MRLQSKSCLPLALIIGSDGQLQENSPISVGWPWSQSPQSHVGQNQQVGDISLYLPPKKLLPQVTGARLTAVL